MKVKLHNLFNTLFSLCLLFIGVYGLMYWSDNPEMSKMELWECLFSDRYFLISFIFAIVAGIAAWILKDEEGK